MKRTAVARRALVLALVLLLSAACGEYDGPDSKTGQQPQGADLRIVLGTQEFPEARILGELWRQALATNGFTVDLRKGVGPAADLDRQLRDDDIDGHVAYTGTVLSVVAKQQVSGLDPEETYQRAKSFYAGRGLAMSAMTPFQNKDAIAVSDRLADSRHLRSIGDLRRLEGLRLGARPEFEHLYLGLDGLRRLYDLTGVDFSPVGLGRQYAALDDGEVDAVDAFTTDPQLRTGRYRLLRDPRLLFGSQNVVMTVRKDRLKRVSGTKFLAVVNEVNRRLTQSAMVDMNAAVTDGQRDETVARDFLSSQGLDQPIGRSGG